MGVELQPGARLRSAACDAELIAVKAPSGPVDLRCGGHPMVPLGDDGPAGLAPGPGFDGSVLIGKRYTDESGEVELLCTKAGTSKLTIGDDELLLKGAKPLPSSD